MFKLGNLGRRGALRIRGAQFAAFGAGTSWRWSCGSYRPRRQTAWPHGRRRACATSPRSACRRSSRWSRRSAIPTTRPPIFSRSTASAIRARITTVGDRDRHWSRRRRAAPSPRFSRPISRPAPAITGSGARTRRFSPSSWAGHPPVRKQRQGHHRRRRKARRLAQPASLNPGGRIPDGRSVAVARGIAEIPPDDAAGGASSSMIWITSRRDRTPPVDFSPSLAALRLRRPVFARRGRGSPGRPRQGWRRRSRRPCARPAAAPRGC